MRTLAISYRISNKSVNGNGYKERRQSLIDAVTAHSHRHWMEATSFILARTKMNVPAMARTISVELSETDDFVVVFDPSDMSWSYFGNVHHPEVLKELLKPQRRNTPPGSGGQRFID